MSIWYATAEEYVTLQQQELIKVKKIALGDKINLFICS